MDRTKRAIRRFASLDREHGEFGSVAVVEYVQSGKRWYSFTEGQVTPEEAQDLAHWIDACEQDAAGIARKGECWT